MWRRRWWRTGLRMALSWRRVSRRPAAAGAGRLGSRRRAPGCISRSLRDRRAASALPLHHPRSRRRRAEMAWPRQPAWRRTSSGRTISVVDRRKLAGILAEGHAIGTPRPGDRDRRRHQRAAAPHIRPKSPHGQRRSKASLAAPSIADAVLDAILARVVAAARQRSTRSPVISCRPGALPRRVPWACASNGTAATDRPPALTRRARCW